MIYEFVNVSISSLKDVPDLPGKCPYFKCSVAAAGKLYKQIFQLVDNKVVPEKNTLAMQHVLQCVNYYQDHFDLKENPVEQSWTDDELLSRVQEFM